MYFFFKKHQKKKCVSYSQNILFKTVHVPVCISIDEVKAESILITYNGGFGIDMMIAGALSFLKAKLPELTSVIVSKE